MSFHRVAFFLICVYLAGCHEGSCHEDGGFGGFGRPNRARGRIVPSADRIQLFPNTTSTFTAAPTPRSSNPPDLSVEWVAPDPGSPLEEETLTGSDIQASVESAGDGFEVTVRAGSNPSPGVYELLVETRHRTYDPARVRVTVVPADGPGTARPVRLAAGGFHSLAMTASGEVWCWGGNGRGQLGTTPLLDRPVADRVVLPAGAEIVSIAAGGRISLARDGTGGLYGWGNDEDEQLGAKPSSVPWHEPGRLSISGAVSQADGDRASVLYLLADGTVEREYADSRFGTAADPIFVDRPGGLHDGNRLDRLVRVSAGGGHHLGLRDDGSVWGWGEGPQGELGDRAPNVEPYFAEPIGGISNAVDVAAGSDHSLALLDDGTVLAWGGNLFGQLGDGTGTSRPAPRPVERLANVTAIAAGWHHSLALDSSGRVWAWGDNSLGQIGTGEPADGAPTNEPLPVQVATLPRVSAIAAGGRHSLALLANCPLVLAWGDNSAGQLGDGTTVPRWLPVQVDGLGEGEALSGCDLQLTILEPAGGEIRVDPGGWRCPGDCAIWFRHGTNLSLRAVPDPGYEFVAWHGALRGVTDAATDLLLDRARNVGAEFRPIGDDGDPGSPAGGPIVFSSDRVDPDGTRDHEIWVLDEDGVATPLTANLVDDLDPAWSPDGRRIAFVRGTGPAFDLWVMDADGSNATEVFEESFFSFREPAWSPDGSTLAFAAMDLELGLWQVAVVDTTDLDGRPIFDLRILDFAGTNDRHPTWSPDGSEVAFTRNGNVVRAPAAGGAAALLLDLLDDVSDPDWSSVPDLLAHATEGGTWVLDRRDGSRTEVAPGGAEPSWSPDGTRIVFRAGDGTLRTVPAAGGASTALPAQEGGNVSPDWGP